MEESLYCIEVTSLPAGRKLKESKTCPCKYLTTNVSIWTAASTNDLNSVIALLHRRPDIVSKLDKYGYTALHYAAQHNNIEIVKLLLSCGLQPDLNTCGATPLHRASYSGSYDCCKLLLEHGASVNATDSSFNDMMTPYQKATANGHGRIMSLLLTFGSHGAGETPETNTVDKTNKLNCLDSNSTDIKTQQLSNARSIDSSESVSSLATTDSRPSFTTAGYPCSTCSRVSLTLCRNANGFLVCYNCKMESRKMVLNR